MANVRTPRSAWVEHGLELLAAGGPETVRVEALARRIGVSKGGFYWHFENRRALLDEILDHWERVSIDEVIETVACAGGDAQAQLARLFELASARRELLEIDLAVRDWARRDRRVARRLRRVDNRRMEFMRTRFSELCTGPDEAESRALLAFSLWIGNHFIAADHGSRSRSEVLELVMRKLLT